MNAVELGGGENPRFRPNLDCRAIKGVDVVADLEKSLPLASEAFDLVFSQYLIEHIGWRDVSQFIGEVFRILKPCGKAIIVAPDLKAQAEELLKKEKWDLKDLEFIFGSQDYPENAHKSSMSAEMAERLFRGAGFNKVNISHLPFCSTDMMIIGEKMERADQFGRKYFDGEGYSPFYRDFPQHYRTAEIILDRKPKTVLEIGGARGYICKILQAHGVPATCMDISQHCWHTRAVKEFILWDATRVPWTFSLPHTLKNGEARYDLCFSVAFLEHVPEDKLEPMVKEMARITKRGLHGITFTIAPNDKDPTHVTIKPKEWWEALFKRVVPKYPVEIMDKEDMEKLDAGTLEKMAPSDGLEKLNIGCFADMFYYGWKNVDAINLEEFARTRGYVFENMDVKNGIKRQDSTVDVILASHFLEHLNREDGARFLAECLRVLKPNGLLRLAVPDAKFLAESYRDGKIMEFRHVNIGVDNAPDDAEAFYHLLLAGHQTIYDAQSLKTALEKAGFADIDVCKPFESASRVIELQTISMYPTLSIYLEVFKHEKKGSEIKRENSALTHVETPSKAPDSGKNLATYKGVTRVVDKLKVALLSTPLLTVPPKNYGGLELVVANLGMELARMGHDVTIFAPKGSYVEGCHMVDVGEPKNTVFIDWLKAETDMFDSVKDQLSQFDIIHGHNWFGMEYRAKALNPKLHVLHTHHGGLVADWWTRSKSPFKLNMVGISKWMKQVYESQGMPTRVVYNGTDMNKYPLRRKKGNRFLWLSRIAFFKAPHLAIQVAKETGIKLDIVGATQFVEDAKYVEQIKKSCDGDQIRFIGEVTNEQKIEYLSNARALLVTGKWGEPFGLHVIEALATGTSVLAVADGGIAETLQGGGVLCQDIEALTDAVKHFTPILPTICRRNAMMFDTKHMALGYLEAYRDILAGKEW